MALCACGCGEQITSRDYLGNLRRYIAHHHLRGKPKSEVTKRRISATKVGSRNPSWKGENAGYAALHNWLARNFEKTGACEECGTERRTEWANIRGVYTHAREEFQELCIPCHRAHDRQHPKRPHLRIGEKDAS